MKKLTFDAANSYCVPYDPLPIGLTAQLQRLVGEERPDACTGCGFENSCATRGCAVLLSVIRVVAVVSKERGRATTVESAGKPW